MGHLTDTLWDIWTFAYLHEQARGLNQLETVDLSCIHVFLDNLSQIFYL